MMAWAFQMKSTDRGFVASLDNFEILMLSFWMSQPPHGIRFLRFARSRRARHAADALEDIASKPELFEETESKTRALTEREFAPG